VNEIVITGGCGFIGSRLALALIESGAAVRVIDVATPPADLAGACAIERRDLRDPGAVRGAFDGAAAVVHCAGLLSRQCDDDPADGWACNVEGTMHVLRELAAPTRVVFLSTGGVYDAGDRYPIDERAPLISRNVYAASKLAGEAMVATAALRSGLTAAVLRLFTVYGPGPASGRRGHFVAGWLERMARGEPLLVHGTGDQTVDATHVSDVVRAIRLVLAAPLVGGASVTYNIGSGRETPVREVARYLRTAWPRTEVRHVPVPRATPARQFGNIARARTELGYEPRIEPHAGLLALAHATLDGRA
jgi:UDP-glucose 4-epimerase